jgi:hypothetical protein
VQLAQAAYGLIVLASGILVLIFLKELRQYRAP